MYDLAAGTSRNAHFISLCNWDPAFPSTILNTRHCVVPHGVDIHAKCRHSVDDIWASDDTNPPSPNSSKYDSLFVFVKYRHDGVTDIHLSA